MTQENTEKVYELRGKTKVQELNIRDQFIISQALCIASKAMADEKYPEDSNIADMEELITNKFPLYRSIEEASKMMNTGCGTTES